MSDRDPALPEQLERVDDLQPTAKPVQRLRIFGREQTRPSAEAADQSAEDNPYWLAEEPDEHPDPSLGCVRRGLCCKSSPGWYGPGELERSAQVLGLDPGEFVKRFAVIDGIDVDGQRVEVFAPVKLDRFGKPAWKPGTRVDGLYRSLRGVCVFYDGTGCRIYQARPIECARYLCTQASELNLSHEQVAALWLSGAGEADSSEP